MKNLLLVLSLTFMGCAPKVGLVKLDEYPASGGGVVKLFANPTSIKRSYREIAIISIDDQGWESSDEEMIAAAKEEAAKIHADAIVMGNETVKSEGAVPIGAGIYANSTERRIRFTAISFTD